MNLKLDFRFLIEATPTIIRVPHDLTTVARHLSSSSILGNKEIVTTTYYVIQRGKYTKRNIKFILLNFQEDLILTIIDKYLEDGKPLNVDVSGLVKDCKKNIKLETSEQDNIWYKIIFDEFLPHFMSHLFGSLRSTFNNTSQISQVSNTLEEFENTIANIYSEDNNSTVLFSVLLPVLKYRENFYTLDMSALVKGGRIKRTSLEGGSIKYTHKYLTILRGVSGGRTEAHNHIFVSPATASKYLKTIYDELVKFQLRLQEGYTISAFKEELKQLFVINSSKFLGLTKKSYFTNNINDTTQVPVYLYKLTLPINITKKHLKGAEINLLLVTDNENYVRYDGKLGIEFDTGFMLLIAFSDVEKIQDFLDSFIDTYNKFVENIVDLINSVLNDITLDLKKHKKNQENEISYETVNKSIEQLIELLKSFIYRGDILINEIVLLNNRKYESIGDYMKPIVIKWPKQRKTIQNIIDNTKLSLHLLSLVTGMEISPISEENQSTQSLSKSTPLFDSKKCVDNLLQKYDEINNLPDIHSKAKYHLYTLVELIRDIGFLPFFAYEKLFPKWMAAEDYKRAHRGNLKKLNILMNKKFYEELLSKCYNDGNERKKVLRDNVKKYINEFKSNVKDQYKIEKIETLQEWEEKFEEIFKEFLDKPIGWLFNKYNNKMKEFRKAING